MNTDSRRSNNLSYLCRSVFICGSVLLVTLLASTAAIAQRGGKAEPNRIEFKRGTHSTAISGTVRGDEQAEDVLVARKGRRLMLTLRSETVKASFFQLLGPATVT